MSHIAKQKQRHPAVNDPLLAAVFLERTTEFRHQIKASPSYDGISLTVNSRLILFFWSMPLQADYAKIAAINTPRFFWGWGWACALIWTTSLFAVTSGMHIIGKKNFPLNFTGLPEVSGTWNPATTIRSRPALISQLTFPSSPIWQCVHMYMCAVFNG